MENTHQTPRLRMIAATLELLSAELDDPARLEVLLRAKIPEGWPPGEYDRPAIEFFRGKIAEDPALVGWLAWYVLQPAGEEDPATLVAAVGFFGPPSSDGTVEIGYSVAPLFERRGFAGEAVAGLLKLAFSEPAVTRVLAHCDADNIGSIRVLARNGFVEVSDYAEPGRREFVLARPARF